MVEKKLLGTYRIAVMEMHNPEAIYFVKNSGDFTIGHEKGNNEIIVSSDSSLFAQEDLKHRFQQIKIPNNEILEVTQDCKYSFEALEKNIQVQRNPKDLFDHLMLAEIYESIDAVDLATSFGGKFISSH